MSRNLKTEYLRKLKKVETPNGYKVDLQNYIYNPAYGHEYPNLYKVIEDTETSQIVNTVRYMKYWDGTGEYIQETYTLPKTGHMWEIVSKSEKRTLETANRFSLNKLIKLAESTTA